VLRRLVQTFLKAGFDEQGGLFQKGMLLHTQCSRKEWCQTQHTCTNSRDMWPHDMATAMALMKATCKWHPERRENRLKRGNTASFTL